MYDCRYKTHIIYPKSSVCVVSLNCFYSSVLINPIDSVDRVCQKKYNSGD